MAFTVFCLLCVVEAAINKKKADELKSFHRLLYNMNAKVVEYLHINVTSLILLGLIVTRSDWPLWSDWPLLSVRIYEFVFQNTMEIKKNIRRFCGWTFTVDDAEYAKKRAILSK